MTKPQREKRSYRYLTLDWSDPEAVRAYNRESQRRWREKNVVRKRKA